MPNKFADWLNANGYRRRRYKAAEALETSPNTVSALCADPPTQWLGRELAIRIRAFTRGEVTPDDFLPPFIPAQQGQAPPTSDFSDVGHSERGSREHPTSVGASAGTDGAGGEADRGLPLLGQESAAPAGLPANRGLPLLGQEEEDQPREAAE